MNAHTKEPLPFPTTDENLQRRHLDEFGYCFIRDALTPDEVKAARDRLIEQAELERERGLAWLKDKSGSWIGSPREGPPGWQGVRLLLNKGEVFRKIVLNRQVHAMMAHAFRGAEYHLSSMTGLIVRKGAPAQVIHSDQMMVPEITTVPYVNNVMFMLTEFTEENGATRLVPGSHKWGRYPPIEIRRDANGTVDGINSEPIESVPAEAPEGVAMVFEGRLWHGQGTSNAEGVRYSMTNYYAQPFIRQQDNMAASIQADVYEKMSDELKALIGFKPVGNLGYLDPAEPGGRVSMGLPFPYVPELHA
jgi:hypothetical protein